MKLSSITLPAVAIGAYAQSVAYSDPATGITFQQHVDPATGYTFGLAVPEDPTTDFIGQLVSLTSKIFRLELKSSRSSLPPG